eukprot:TRINITY_DN1455_c0_g1_i2.p1 TRINITY_DN1455_c0_g1~~TRINITY_DN1455_c0_g1_i2.p1  ORF type:complete len:410 (-),score=101.89 TRINITY_DN1455_c0_g1_i2:115-1344(-)
MVPTTIHKTNPSNVFTLESSFTRDFFTSIIQLSSDGSFLTASHTDYNRATFSMLTPPTLIKRYARKRADNEKSKEKISYNNTRRLLKRSYSDGQQLSCVQTFRGHQRVVNCLVEIDSQTFASCSGDKTIKLWSLVDGSVVKDVVRAHNHHITTLLHIKDDRNDLLVSGGKDAVVKVWRLPDMQLVHTLQGHAGAIVSLHQLNDGLIASNSLDSQIKIWNINNRNNSESSGNDNEVKSCDVKTLNDISDNVIVFPDGVIVSLTKKANNNDNENKEVKLWNSSTGVCYKTLDHDRCQSIRKLNDGVFLTVSSDVVIGWNKLGEKVLTLLVRSLPDHVIGLRDGDAIAMVNLRQKNVSVWNVIDKKMNLVNMCCNVIGKQISTHVQVLSEYLPAELYNHCWYFYQHQQQQCC